MKQKINELTPVEGNLFVDDRGRKILVDSWSKKAYRVKKEQVSKQGVFANRHVMSVVLTGFFGFYFNWIWGIIVGLLLFIVLELFYRKGFLNSLEQLDIEELPELPSRVVVMAKQGKRDNLVKLICGILLPFILVVYVLMVIGKGEDLTSLNNLILFIFSAIAAVYALYIAILSAKALQIIKKEGK